jgi:hypothetical protein
VIGTVVRVLVGVTALAVLFITPLYTQSSDGTTALQPVGVVIDAIALVVLVAIAWSLWPTRGRI